MNLICKLLGHRPGIETRNEGLDFATCERCEADVIRRQGGDWVRVPLGLRVAWHPSGHQGVHWSKAMTRLLDRRQR